MHPFWLPVYAKTLFTGARDHMITTHPLTLEIKLTGLDQDAPAKTGSGLAAQCQPS